jgi:hypothetical protein
MADGGNGAVAAPPVEKPNRPRWPASRWPALRRRDREDEPIVTFSDLVWEHWRWERQRHSGTFDPVVERDYQRCLGAFQQRYGEITDAYWSIRDASGVALTVKRRRVRPIPYSESVPRFHASVDWATREEPSIAQVLNDCGVLAIRVGEVLRGSSELIALRRIISVASHLLGFVDRTHGRPENDVIAVAVPGAGARQAPEKPRRGREQAAGRFAREQRKELKKVEVFYDRAGNKQARIVYFWGMVLGYVYLVPLAAAGTAALWWVDQLAHPKADWHRIELVLVSGAAGPLGAILSVLTRIASNTGKFDLDYEVGRKQVRWLGIYRPLLGAIFGVATYLLLASGLLQTSTPGGSAVAYYGSLAFLAGFFERFMKVAPGGAPTPMDPEEEPEKDAKASKQKSTT